MKVSIVALLQESNLTNFIDTLNRLREQTIGFENIELIILDQAVEKTSQEVIELSKLSQEANIHVQKESEVNFASLKGKYISFFDFNYSISPHLYSELYNTAEKKGLDFVSANADSTVKTNMDASADVIKKGFNALTSLKLIKKDTLLQHPQLVSKSVTSTAVEAFHFLVYTKKLSFNYIGKLKCKNGFTFDEDYISSSIGQIGEVNRALQMQAPKELNEAIKFQLLTHMLYLIDKNTFTNNLTEEKQTIAYNELRSLLALFSSQEIKSCGIDGYIPIFKMLDKNLDEEATEYIKLLRSKRHWYEQTNKYKQYFKKNPYSLEESLSWKVTKPFRKASSMLRSLKQSLYKGFLVAAASLVKVSLFNRKVWLVGEREDQAEDNGYFFFKYCREHYPNQKVYYIINEDSPHLDKVKKHGNVIHHSSFKHQLYMLVASTYISAWTFEECSYPRPKETFKKLFKKQLATKYNICLQHGVIIHNISPYLHKERYNQNLIISSSEYEKKIIQNTLGYSENEVAVTGLARFDNLHELDVKKQILIMPTWRRHLFKINKNSFLKSDYYKAYKNLITNQEFLEMIERHNIPVKFYIHSQMQKFMDQFVIDHPNIEFLVKSTATVSELLKESSLLITDYSSVSSDFLYMDKPVIMYQFDPHNNHHTQVKEIQYNHLGMIVSNENQLMSAIGSVVNNDFKANKQYLKNSQRIFKYKDQNNCQRIYNVIKQKTS
jgi:CDP-glycerol glycerophosphotransferase (TagB/SpsB family)